jgi:hypothetical protein
MREVARRMRGSPQHECALMAGLALVSRHIGTAGSKSIGTSGNSFEYSNVRVLLCCVGIFSTAEFATPPRVLRSVLEHALQVLQAY